MFINGHHGPDRPIQACSIPARSGREFVLEAMRGHQSRAATRLWGQGTQVRTDVGLCDDIGEGRIFRYAPATDKQETLADLTQDIELE